MPDDNPIENSRPAIWKISHGGRAFSGKKGVKEREDLRAQNLVVACYNEKSNRGGRQSFKDDIKEGDFFFLCYGSEIQLLGRFIGGEAQPYTKRKGWFGWEYTVIAEAKKSSYKRTKGQNGGDKKGWEPDMAITCSCVEGDEEEKDFEKWILKEYFGTSVADLRSKFEECGYWWLNANDGIRDFLEIPIGGTEPIKLTNDNGNDRREPGNFSSAKVGDVVVVYQSQKIIALCEISKSVNRDDPKDKQNIQIRKWKALESPISIDELKELENLGSEEPFQKAPSDQGPFAVKRGTLFKLTKHGFDPIMDLIYKKNLPHTPPDVPSPTPVIPNNEEPKHWWLNIDLSIDGAKSFTLFGKTMVRGKSVGKDGVLEGFSECFREANAGDTVYLSNPFDMRLVAICKIKAKQNGKIQIVEEKHLSGIPNENLEDRLGREMECLKKPSGVLYKLTKEEVDCIDDEVENHSPDPKQKEELIEEFLSEVYLGKGKTKKEADADGKKKYDKLVRLLENKKNIILQGPPGVGKTFAARRLAYAMMGEKDDSRIKLVQFHQNYSYEDFVEGYKPRNKKDPEEAKEEGEFVLRPGVFRKFCDEARGKEEPYFFIIDEINRGNMSKIFGELLMLIEKDYRGDKYSLELAYSRKKFSVPENLFIIGMMNTADRSLAMLDYALRRRFAFVDMEPAFDAWQFKDQNKTFLGNPNFKGLIDWVTDLNEKVITEDQSLGNGFCIGHSYFCGWEECTEDKMCDVLLCDILPMLEEYWFDSKDKVKKLVNGKGEGKKEIAKLPKDLREKLGGKYDMPTTTTTGKQQEQQSQQQPQEQQPQQQTQQQEQQG